MTSTLNPACPLCGLRYASKPLLELQTAMTATRRPRPGQLRTVPRRALRALRHVNDELTRASEAIIRSARAPQPRPRIQAPAARDTRPATAADRAGRAA